MTESSAGGDGERSLTAGVLAVELEDSFRGGRLTEIPSST